VNGEDPNPMVEETEPVADFRRRAAAWIPANLRPRDERSGMGRGSLPDEEELAAVRREREVQRMLFDAGFAGICVPRRYGGQGLTAAHQAAFNEELRGYEFPERSQVPNFSPCMAVLLEFGTEEQKLRHVPAILKGEELWMQLLSEPSGGSDAAGALTTAVRDGEEWVLNGSKIWTTGAWWSDWGLCLVRTNWDVPKHRGLTVFMLPLHQPGIEIHRIEMLDGSKEFCQEFITDVRLPDGDRIGDVDDGWTVGTRWMFHERMLYNSPLVTRPPDVGAGGAADAAIAAVARATGRADDPLVQDLVGEARMLSLVGAELQQRLAGGIRDRRIPDQSAAIGRLFWGVSSARNRTIALDIAGSTGAAWSAADGEAAGVGVDYLTRQAGSIGGGTTEMARNVISERVLGMPRERTLDRDVPFREVPRGPAGGGRR
jgi:alkylation response protein AidB-like acyl-CoA dehydrogenase